MTSLIKKLPEAIANQIAAGEVVQRPASALKELMENAVDSGADEISVRITDAGKSLIQVVDNGCGMSDEDALNCFERHATSKIRAFEDLYEIRTNGFRGEAMPSMAAVSRLELRTRLHDAETGTSVLIEGGKFQQQESISCPPGTSVSIKNLFFNVPARRNFLKSDAVETRHLVDTFQRIALAYPELFFSLTINGQEQFHLRKGNLRQRIVGIFGKTINEKLIPAEEKTSVLDITGFIGKPAAARKTRGEQYFFVNQRFIRSPYLNHAVNAAFEQLIPEKSHPFYVLLLEIDPSRVDVNVHPTKTEVKFEDEKIIYTFVQAAVRHALASHNLTPTLDFEQDSGFTHLDAFVRPGGNTGGSTGAGGVTVKRVPSKSTAEPWEKLFDEAPAPAREQGTLIIPSELGETESAVPETAAGPFQLHQRYLLSPIKSGLLIVDQHSAHERILYEKHLATLDKGGSSSQQQLFSKTINLPAADAVLLTEILPDLNRLGFDIRDFGGGSFIIQGVPAYMEEWREELLLEMMLEDFKQNKGKLGMALQENLARSLARAASIKAGKKLSLQEMRRLIDELFACRDPHKSPSGRKTHVVVGLDEMAGMFGR